VPASRRRPRSRQLQFRLPPVEAWNNGSFIVVAMLKLSAAANRLGNPQAVNPVAPAR